MWPHQVNDEVNDQVNDSAIRFLLPVLWTASYFPIIGHMTRGRGRIHKVTHRGGGRTEAELMVSAIVFLVLCIPKNPNRPICSPE